MNLIRGRFSAWWRDGVVLTIPRMINKQVRLLRQKSREALMNIAVAVTGVLSVATLARCS